MLYVSLPKDRVHDSPAVVTDRLRSWWNNPGVYLILEVVPLSIQAGDDEPAIEEHFLMGVEGKTDELPALLRTMTEHDLPAPTLWEQANVIRTVEDFSAYYLKEGLKELGGAIHQRFSEALPDSYVVLSNAGRYFLKARSVMEASGYLERAYSIAPHVAEVAINFMILRQMEGDEATADLVLRKLGEEHPDHPVVRQLIEEAKRNGKSV
jgi:hypothetical protein